MGWSGLLKLTVPGANMNPRIQEIAEQAEKYADYGFKGEINWSEAYEAKFAELIVQQCAQIADKAWAAPGYQIKQYFGVEP